MVMDIEHSNPDPGTPVISYRRNDTDLLLNQLWMKEHAGENTFYLVSKLGPDCKLNIQVITSYSLYFSLHQLSCFLFKFVNWLSYKYISLNWYFYYHMFGGKKRV